MAKRLLELEPSSLFDEKAIVMTLNGREEISRPFEFMLTIASPKKVLKPEQVIGQPLAVRIDRGDEEPRYIHGYISHLWAGDFSKSLDDASAPSRVYRIRLVPWVWFMTRAARCFVYLPEKQEKSIQDVLDELIKRVKSYGHVEAWNESANASILKSRKVEHCVQYRESDFNFLSRTLERYGVYYYFKHEKDKHTLVLSDQSNYPSCVEADVEYPVSGGGQTNTDTITSWEHSYQFVSGKWEQTDYDFLQPSTDLKVNALKHSSISLQNNAEYELYEYPGEYVQKGDGEKEAAIRLECEEARFNVVSAGSTCKTFMPGHSFKLSLHHSCEDEKGKQYVLTSITHTASQPGPFSSTSLPASYTNKFECIPRDSQYRPPRSTPQPMLASVQTAVIVGPAGEEIYTDEYGRVKVQFHWDREGKHDENTSCWIRASQVHAGKSFGGIDIPRVGEEVVVSFLEGDLDRPLITGRVYHKESMPPFGLPAAKTVSGIKTKTYKGKGYNELSMDDVPGKEKITVHAQYDMGTTVEHDDTQTVHHDRVITVDGKHTETIDKDTTIKIKTGNLDHNVVTGTATYHVAKAVKETFDATLATTVKNNITVSSTEGEILIEAAKKITLHTGSSKITLESNGVITLHAIKINIIGDEEIKESAPTIGVEASKQAKLGVGNQNITCDKTKTALAGAAINSSAVGMHEITGALVKIN